MKISHLSALTCALMSAAIVSGCGQKSDGSSKGGGGKGSADQQNSTQSAVAAATATTKAASVVGLADQYEELVKKPAKNDKAKGAAAVQQVVGGYDLKSDGGCRISSEFKQTLNATNGMSQYVDILDSTEAMCKMRNLTKLQCQKALKLAAQIKVRSEKLDKKCNAPRGDAFSAALLIKDSISLRESLQVTPPTQKKAPLPAKNAKKPPAAAKSPNKKSSYVYASDEADAQQDNSDDDATAGEESNDASSGAVAL